MEETRFEIKDNLSSPSLYDVCKCVWDSDTKDWLTETCLWGVSFADAVAWCTAVKEGWIDEDFLI